MAGLTFRKRKKRINYNIIKEGFVWLAELALAFFIACLLVVNFGVMTSNVGQSMEPTLASGDRVLTNRLIYKLTDPKRGDLVVFKPNGNENSHFYIKRVAAEPGDTVQIKGGFLYVNEELVTDLPIATITNPGMAEEPLKVETDCYFVIGDNPNSREDSRYADIRNVNRKDIEGKPWFVISGENKGRLR